MTNHLSADAYREISKALNIYLANTTIVYYKTHAFHWNVEGPEFYSLHLMFEKFYQEIWESMDDIAERIRALRNKTPESLSELLKLATLKEAPSLPAHSLMIRNLRDDYILLTQNAHKVGEIAGNLGDTVTTDMVTEQASFLEKAAWMLQSTTIG